MMLMRNVWLMKRRLLAPIASQALMTVMLAVQQN
jgi:hypothetical protein